MDTAKITPGGLSTLRVFSGKLSSCRWACRLSGAHHRILHQSIAEVKMHLAHTLMKLKSPRSTEEAEGRKGYIGSTST